MKLNADKLEGHLKGALKPAYLVSGDDPLLSQEVVGLIREAAKSQGYLERELMTVQRGFDWAELARVAQAGGSLFSERRLIDLRLAGKAGKDGSKALLQYLESPPQDLLLLVTCGRLDKSAQKTKWVKTLEQVGAFVQVWPPRADQLPGWLSRRMVSKGLRANAQAAQTLAERVEGNLLAAVQEIDKLALLYGSQPISAAEVEKSVADSARFEVFGLTDSALAGDTRRALRIASGLRREDSPLPVLASLISREVRILNRLRHAMDHGQSLQSIMREAGAWERRKALLQRAMRRLSAADLKGLLRGCAALDRMVKGQASGDPWQLLERIVVTMCGVKGQVVEPVR